MARYKKWVWSGKKQQVLVLDVRKGYTQKEIAAKVGLAPSTVCELMQTEEYEIRKTELMTNVVDDAREVIKQDVMKSVRKLGELVTKGNNAQKIQLEAAKTILHFAGFEPEKITEIVTREYKPDELASSLGVANEIEKVTHRISVEGSKHIINKSENAPIEARKEDAGETGAIQGPVEAASTVGQEALPEKPVLPV